MEWISIEDSLPEYGQIILIWQGKDGFYKGRRTHTDHNGEHWENSEWDGGTEVNKHVSHWMKIYEPK